MPRRADFRAFPRAAAAPGVRGAPDDEPDHRGRRVILPVPARSTVISLTPSPRSARPAASASAAACSPFSARTIPPVRTSGTARVASRSSGATARAVTTSAATCPRASSARPRRTVTLRSPRAARHSSRNTTRRAIGSSSVTCTSGSSMASTMPGRPAPDPISSSVARARHQVSDHRAVQQMPFPQPLRLTRAYQATDRCRRWPACPRTARPGEAPGRTRPARRAAARLRRSRLPGRAVADRPHSAG